MRPLSKGLLSVIALTATFPARAETAIERLCEASIVFSEVMRTPDKGIPQDLLHDAHCIVIVPGVKEAAFIIGAKYGKGFVVCRNRSNNGWGAPAAIRIEGGSIGWQVGGSETDVIMLVMNQRGMERLLQSKFTLGGSAEVAAGTGWGERSAGRGGQMTSKDFTLGRARGGFSRGFFGGAPPRDG